MTRPYGGWITFRYLEQNQKLKNEIVFPPRHRLLVRNALKLVGLRYKEIIPFYDPAYHGYKQQTVGSIQWVDFLIYEKHKRIMFAIQFRLAGGAHKRTKERYNSKINYLEQRGIKVLQLRRDETTQAYEMRIRMFIRRLEK